MYLSITFCSVNTIIFYFSSYVGESLFTLLLSWRNSIYLFWYTSFETNNFRDNTHLFTHPYIYTHILYEKHYIHTHAHTHPYIYVRIYFIKLYMYIHTHTHAQIRYTHVTVLLPMRNLHSSLRSAFSLSGLGSIFSEIVGWQAAREVQLGKCLLIGKYCSCTGH